MREKKFRKLRKMLGLDNSVTDEEFASMKKVTVDKSYKDKRFHLYFNAKDRIAFRLIILFFLIFTGFIFVQKSYLFETKNEIEYTEYGNVNYKVLVNNDEYYDSTYMESGKQYLSDVVNTIDAVFNYNLNFNSGMNYKYTYKVEGILYIDSKESGKNLVTNTYSLVKPNKLAIADGTSINLELPIKIDYQQYNEYVKNYKQKYNVLTESRLVVKLSLDYEGVAAVFKEKKQKSSVVEMVIPLGNKETSISVNGIDNKDSFVEVSASELINDVLFSIGLVLLLSAVLLFICTIIFVIRVTPKKSKYCKKRDELLKTYDRVIVVSKTMPEINDLNVISCNTFNELFDAQQSLDKPIIFHELIKNQKAMFVIRNDNDLYKYVLKDCDL